MPPPPEHRSSPIVIDWGSSVVFLLPQPLTKTGPESLALGHYGAQAFGDKGFWSIYSALSPLSHLRLEGPRGKESKALEVSGSPTSTGIGLHLGAQSWPTESSRPTERAEQHYYDVFLPSAGFLRLQQCWHQMTWWKGDGHLDRLSLVPHLRYSWLRWRPLVQASFQPNGWSVFLSYWIELARQPWPNTVSPRKHSTQPQWWFWRQAG